jgi:hypothetical protein
VTGPALISSTSDGRLPGMSSTEFAGAFADAVRDRFRRLPDGLMWFLARCERCNLENDVDNGVPFRDEGARDDWAAVHVTATGHVVYLLTHATQDLPAMHLTGVISRAAPGDFRFLCPAPTCSRSNGPYASAQQAIASWRTHPVLTAVSDSTAVAR